MPVDRNFRAALNGFNRSDVVNYIEECSINHEKALRQLRDENARLRADLERLQAEKDALDQQQEEPEVAQAPEEAPLQDEVVTEEAPCAEQQPSTGEELAAYRRAEAVERSAQKRAAGLCRQVNEIVENAAHQFQNSSADVEALMSDLNICLRRLNDTFAELRLTFDDTTAAFAGIEMLDADADQE